MISYAALDAALLSGGSDVVAVQKLHHAPHAHTHTHTPHAQAPPQACNGWEEL